MTRILLSTRKTLEEQATERFDAAKKAKRKLTGVNATIERYTQETEAGATTSIADSALRNAVNASNASNVAVSPSSSQPRTRAWYERFRWSTTRNGFLLVGGRDAGTNEVLLKRHLETNDRVFHTAAPGSPFVLLKQTSVSPNSTTQNSSPEKVPNSNPERMKDNSSLHSPAASLTDEDLEDAATFCAAYSKLWKAGAAHGEAFWVLPEQVSKSANSGEYVGRGSFIIRGERNTLRVSITIAIGTVNGIPASGAPAALARFSPLYALLAPGDEKTSETARKVLKKLPGTPDDYVLLVPPGGARLLGWRRAVYATAPSLIASSTTVSQRERLKVASPEEKS
jgi:hypothetical protein